LRCHSLISLQIILSLQKIFPFSITLSHFHFLRFLFSILSSSHPYPYSLPLPILIPNNVWSQGAQVGVWAHAQVDAGVAGGPELQVGRRDQRREGGEVGGRLEELERVVDEGQRGHRNACK